MKSLGLHKYLPFTIGLGSKTIETGRLLLEGLLYA
jgi:hypothetical protein